MTAPADGAWHHLAFTIDRGTDTGTIYVDGVATNQDLEAASPLLRVNGRGTVDLPADQLVADAAVGLPGGQAEEPVTGLVEMDGVRLVRRAFE